LSDLRDQIPNESERSLQAKIHVSEHWQMTAKIGGRFLTFSSGFAD
jgi:hypothetical protein